MHPVCLLLPSIEYAELQQKFLSVNANGAIGTIARVFAACKKLEDGTLIFSGPLNHFAQHSDDYLQMGKAWREVLRWINDAVFKFNEDQRRIDEMMEGPPDAEG